MLMHWHWHVMLRNWLPFTERNRKPIEALALQRFSTWSSRTRLAAPTPWISCARGATMLQGRCRISTMLWTRWKVQTYVFPLFSTQLYNPIGKGARGDSHPTFQSTDNDNAFWTNPCHTQPSFFQQPACSFLDHVWFQHTLSLWLRWVLMAPWSCGWTSWNGGSYPPMSWIVLSTWWRGPWQPCQRDRVASPSGLSPRLNAGVVSETSWGLGCGCVAKKMFFIFCCLNHQPLSNWGVSLVVLSICFFWNTSH